MLKGTWEEEVDKEVIKKKKKQYQDAGINLVAMDLQFPEQASVQLSSKILGITEGKKKSNKARISGVKSD